jgi:hypothetical protein
MSDSNVDSTSYLEGVKTLVDSAMQPLLLDGSQPFSEGAVWPPTIYCGEAFCSYLMWEIHHHGCEMGCGTDWGKLGALLHCSNWRAIHQLIRNTINQAKVADLFGTRVILLKHIPSHTAFYRGNI